MTIPASAKVATPRETTCLVAIPPQPPTLCQNQWAGHKSTWPRAVSTNFAVTSTSLDRTATERDVGWNTGHSLAISRDMVSCASPPPGSWGLVSLLIQAVDPLPGSVSVFRPATLRCHARRDHNIATACPFRLPSRQQKREHLIQCQAPRRAITQFATRETQHRGPVPTQSAQLSQRNRSRTHRE